MLELYHNNMSSCAQKVRIVLREKQVPHVEHHVNLRAGEQNTPEYRKLNPNGVVPTLVVDGRPIVESSVICEYIEDAYSQHPLRPADLVQRARMRLWTIQPDAGLHAAVGQTCMAVAFRHQILARGPEVVAQMLAARPPAMREQMRGLLELGVEAPGVPAAVRRFEQLVVSMAQQLQQTPWLCGEVFTLADAMALPYVVRLEHLGFEWWWQGEDRQVINDWLARCKARPSYAAINDYLDADYMELLARTGREVRPGIEALLKS